MMSLEESVLNTRQEQYLDWLCTAPQERTPPSKQKYSEQNKVAAQTLRNWEKNASFREEWKKRVDNIQGSPDKSFSLLESLYQRAMDGDMKAADLYLRATNRMAPQPLKVETVKSAAELSDAELSQLIAARAQSELTARAAVTVPSIVDGDVAITIPL